MFKTHTTSVFELQWNELTTGRAVNLTHLMKALTR